MGSPSVPQHSLSEPQRQPGTVRQSLGSCWEGGGGHLLVPHLSQGPGGVVPLLMQAASLPSGSA